MKKWQDLAAPDDPNSWYAVSSMWPTRRARYKSADTSSPTSMALVGTTTVIYAFAAKQVDGTTREYVVTTTGIYQYSAGALTDRTGGVAIGGIGHPMMVQYGNIMICVMGAATATVSSSGGNFAALAGAPQAEIVVVQSNAVVVFNTNTSADGWAASDVGDYTNWTTGEAASGRIFTTAGPILAAVPFGNDIIVFKRSAIYRMTYVGGVIKWAVQLVWKGMGVAPLNYENGPKYAVAACAAGVVFNAALNLSASPLGSLQIYLFDGASKPRCLNPATTLIGGWGQTVSGTSFTHEPVFFYDPVEDMLCIADSQGSGGVLGAKYYYYSFPTDAWGSGGGGAAPCEGPDAALGGGGSNGVLQGDYYAQGGSSKPIFYRYGSTALQIRRCAPASPVSSYTCSLTSSLYGRMDRKTTWTRLAPALFSRTDLGSGSASLSGSTYSERELGGAPFGASVSESTVRRRFDFLYSGNFANFTVTWTNFSVEVDDFLVKSKDAGED